ncbi:hypothetical protein Pint_27164 [Pistacia integerrima]|uniref:Uncharacterized protein n=1 Tax=Pistacia integerrima TaxID=434235 RepID=A0ACC0YTG8_9ROSI|nr:hypothetical protein Pint_27164 [Pistacia integerrima]
MPIIVQYRMGGWGDNVTLNLDVDAHLYLLNSSSFNSKNITGVFPTGEKIYLMKVDSDGIFRLYSHNLRQNGTSSIEWQSSNNKCAPMGECGFNSYCVLNDQKGECLCVPGFAFVNQGNWTSVTLFKSEDHECKMQRLPLRFGRRDMDGGSNNFTFIKEGIVSSSGDIVPQEEKKGL